MRGDGSAATSFSDSLSVVYLFIAAPVNANAILQIMDYSATDKHKTSLLRSNIPGASTIANAARWPETTAINSVNLFTSGGTMNAGATFDLYGVIA
jgi:hypothetical protein